MFAPIENSPPEIQTIPSGTFPGGEFLLVIVGSNSAAPAHADEWNKVNIIHVNEAAIAIEAFKI
jgi:hypothetical protein